MKNNTRTTCSYQALGSIADDGGSGVSRCKLDEHGGAGRLPKQRNCNFSGQPSEDDCESARTRWKVSFESTRRGPAAQAVPSLRAGVLSVPLDASGYRRTSMGVWGAMGAKGAMPSHERVGQFRRIKSRFGGRGYNGQRDRSPSPERQVAEVTVELQCNRPRNSQACPNR